MLFRSQAYRAVLIPLHEILDESELPEESHREAVAAWRAAIVATDAGAAV